MPSWSPPFARSSAHGPPVRRVSELATWVLAIALCVAAVALHIWVAVGALAPVYWEDEAGYLLNAQVMSGFGDVPSLQGNAYYPGWSLALVPLWWIFQDPQTVYRASVFVGVVFALAVAVPLTLLGRHYSLSLPRAIAAAALVVLLPSNLLQSNWAMSEHALTFVVALSALLAVRYAARPGAWRAVALGAVVGAAFVVHGRAVPVLIAAVLWFAYRAYRFERASLAGVAAAAAVAVPGYLVHQSLSAQLFPGTAREQEAIGTLLTSEPAGVALSAVGQTWYQVVVSLCLLGFGVAGLAVLVGREWRARRPGVASWFALALVGVAAISFTYLNEWVWPLSERLDTYVYGRYLSPFVAVLVFAGLVIVLSRTSRRFITVTSASTLVFLLASRLVLDHVLPRFEHGGRWTPLNVLGLAQWSWDGGVPLLIPSLIATAGLGAIVVLTLWIRRPVLIVALFALYFATMSVITEVGSIRPFTERYYSAFSLRLAIDEFVPEHSLSFDLNGVDLVVPAPDTVSSNAYQFWLVPNSPPLFDSRIEQPTTELVIARRHWDLGTELGARRVALDTGFDNVLWVMPGELCDELTAQHRLLSVRGLHFVEREH